jgi:hypothetical protein
MKRSDGEVSDSSQLAGKTQKLAVRTSAGVERYSYIQLCTVTKLFLKKTVSHYFALRLVPQNKTVSHYFAERVVMQNNVKLSYEEWH